MADTYSSWEYSQGPTLYIDSSGFESIDADKNFVYYYIVTYGPVEYKRKVTDDKGQSTYEYKYSFGIDMTARKVLDRFTFTGKDQLTKTVTHEVTEEGFKKSITKTFIIDTNIDSNLNTNTQITLDPTYKVNTNSWGFFNSTSKSYLGWITETKTGYRTETEYVTKTGYRTKTGTRQVAIYTSVRVSYDTISCPDWGGCFLKDIPHRHIINEVYERRFSHYETETYTYQEPYTYQEAVSCQKPYNYTETYNSHCKLDLKAIREKISDYDKYSSVVFIMKTKYALNKPPTVTLTTDKSTKANKTQLTPKSDSSISCNGLIEYYMPNSLITTTYKNYDTIDVVIEKGNCSSATGEITEAFAFIEIEAATMPYINLIVQAYNAASDTWNEACVIPYLNYQEIESMRASKQHVSKNLFFPSNLPKTDANYRIQLDTNLVAHEAERFTNFRIDVLSDQLILPGSMSDRKLYLNNDSLEFENEVEVANIDEIKLNVLGFSTHTKKPYAGFLKKGANEVHAYLKDAVFVVEDDIPYDNISKNEFYTYITEGNGNWLSNNIFAANTFELGQISTLGGDNPLYEDNLITFKIPYSALKPNASYTFIFEAHAEDSFSITDTATVDAADEDKVLKSKIYAELSVESPKVVLTDYEKVFYSPPYKLKNQDSTELIDEENICERDVPVRIELNTYDIAPDEQGTFTLKIKRYAMKNVILKSFQVLCIDENDNRYIDVFEPYNIDIFTGRQFDTFMTMYYDGFHLEHINPLLYRDMIYLRTELDKIRSEYTLQPYPWTEWTNTYDPQGNLIVDEYGNALGVELDQPVRAAHFNDVKQCCVSTYEELLALRPPVSLNTSPTQMREGINLIPLNDEDPTQGYVLQHYIDRFGNVMDVDKYFPEWRQIIELINRN